MAAVLRIFLQCGCFFYCYNILFVKGFVSSKRKNKKKHEKNAQKIWQIEKMSVILHR